jgi:ferric-dicitrate binding protein FerR (iron transport regulator)
VFSDSFAQSQIPPNKLNRHRGIIHYQLDWRMSMKSMRTFLILVMVVASAALVAFGIHLPQASPVTGKLLLQAGATVTVNGTSAISGATVFSDSTVTTAKGSSAVVSLGKLGRVELKSETSVKLIYTDSSIALTMLTSGASPDAAATQGRSLFILSTNPGVSGTAITADGQVMTDSTKRTEFTVDTSCGDTLVSVQKGSVTLRAGDSVKQIAAGSQDTAGTATPGCTRSPMKSMH